MGCFLMGVLPTIPEYYKKYINPNVDLTETRNIPCDIHGEKEGKSFSYSPSLNKWRCFGKCKCGGDVIRLHQLNYNFSSYKEAEDSLRAIYQAPKTFTDLNKEPPKVDEDSIRFKVAYNRAINIARKSSADTWLELDYILSQYPPDINKLEVFINGH